MKILHGTSAGDQNVTMFVGEIMGWKLLVQRCCILIYMLRDKLQNNVTASLVDDRGTALQRYRCTLEEGT